MSMQIVSELGVEENDGAANGVAAGVPAARWGAVLALSLCVATLVASEFMPVSLLTPIAADLHVTEGQAGQAIAVSGAFALATSLFIGSPRRAPPPPTGAVSP